MVNIYSTTHRGAYNKFVILSEGQAFFRLGRSRRISLILPQSEILRLRAAKMRRFAQDDSSEVVVDILKSYRQKIDDLDAEIVELLRQRYDVIREVGHIKARENLPAVLQDRVDEVVGNAERMALEQGLDAEFIRDLYVQLVKHSCNLEEDIIARLSGRKAARP